MRNSVSCALSLTVMAAAVGKTVRAEKFLAYVRQGRPATAEDWSRLPPVVVILPLLDEAPVIDALFSAIGKLRYPRDRLYVLAATAEEAGGGPSSREAVQRVIDGAPDDPRRPVRCVHLGRKSTCKADQLNAALAEARRICRERSWPETSLVVGVFDADSRPESDLLIEVGSAFAQDPDLEAMQAYPVYLDDLEARTPQMKVEALRQTARSFCVEAPRALRYQRASAGLRSTVDAHYLIGHGQFFRGARLIDAGFPTGAPIDDLVQGFAYTLAGLRTRTAVHFDHCTVPLRTTDFVRQTRTWFVAQCSAGEMIRQRRRLDGRRASTGTWLRLGWLIARDAVPWLGRGLEVPLAVADSWRLRSSRPMALCAAALWFEWQSERYVLQRLRTVLDVGGPEVSSVRAMARPTLKALGPMSAVCLRLTGVEVKGGKTPRD
ncbi:glycosyltransferase [Kitasatospora sp. NPDC056783]|uniref:glycosyltransferase n=1 Tax=Kitasatospora sp. NPDC056783 TaxID=3345943 RepID=UPI0036996B6C